MDGNSVFFSYGHDCTEIVMQLKASLEQVGYSVWLDTDGIRPGDDWRERITQGILSCDRVIAFLSNHSLRKDSVCLNELAIAVSHKQGRIKTVLLEPGLTDKIPATISCIQYCDLSQWRQYRRSSPQEFAAWYQQGLEQLLAALERDNSAELDYQLKYLEQTLSPNLSSSRRNVELQKPYISRPWMDEKIDAWLSREDSSQYYLLYGGPGTGKSAFAAHYFHFDARVAGSVFYEWGCKNYSHPAQIIKNIAFQLAAKLPTYRARLVYLLEDSQGALSDYTARELFDLLLLQPTCGDMAAGDAVLVIIDGVDEANEGGNNELAEILASYQHRLPAFLKILITSRNDAVIRRYFSGCDQLHIDANLDDNCQDLVHYLRGQLQPELAAYPRWRQEQLLREMAVKSHNSFLYAELLVKSIRGSGLPLDESTGAPEGLFGLYFNWMQRQFPDPGQYEDHYFPALSLIAAANRLPLELLDKALGLKGMALKRFLRQMKTFLETDRGPLGEEYVYFFHRSFAEWLCGDSADLYQLDVEEAVTTLALTMYKSYESGRLSDYETEYVLEYLVNSGLAAQYDAITADRSFLRRLCQLGQSYERVPGGFQNSLHLYQQAERLLNHGEPALEESRSLAISLRCGQGRCLFALGRFQEALTMLETNLEEILALGGAEERLRTLMIIGAAYDWKGERDRSILAFERLLHSARQEDDPRYILSAYQGLIWNDHFNNLQQALESLPLATAAGLGVEEQMACNLCLSRIWLSNGQLTQALASYDQCLADFDFQRCDDFYTYKKNRMLLLEILPACFDNGRYVEGVRRGLRLWGQVMGRSWLEECYCASWLALNYLRLGDLAAAEQYLYHAQACNNTLTDLAKSHWMQMHLTSVEGFLHFEQGRYREALAAHQTVRSLARDCSDAWVQGDACYELLKIRLCFLPPDPAADSEVESLADELATLALSSGLPHLRCKSGLIASLRLTERDPAAAWDWLQQARALANDWQLASLDPVETRYLEYRIISQLPGPYRSQAALSQALAALRTTIAAVVANNSGPDPAAGSGRPLIQRILSEVSPGENEY